MFFSHYLYYRQHGCTRQGQLSRGVLSIAIFSNQISEPSHCFTLVVALIALRVFGAVALYWWIWPSYPPGRFVADKEAHEIAVVSRVVLHSSDAAFTSPSLLLIVRSTITIFEIVKRSEDVLVAFISVDGKTRRNGRFFVIFPVAFEEVYLVDVALNEVIVALTSSFLIFAGGANNALSAAAWGRKVEGKRAPVLRMIDTRVAVINLLNDTIGAPFLLNYFGGLINLTSHLSLRACFFVKLLIAYFIRVLSVVFAPGWVLCKHNLHEVS